MYVAEQPFRKQLVMGSKSVKPACASKHHLYQLCNRAKVWSLTDTLISVIGHFNSTNKPSQLLESSHLQTSSSLEEQASGSFRPG